MTRSSFGEVRKVSAPLLRDRFGERATRRLTAPVTPRWIVWLVCTMYGLSIGMAVAVAGVLLGWW